MRLPNFLHLRQPALLVLVAAVLGIAVMGATLYGATQRASAAARLVN